jgi:Right handed beta helix region
VEHPPPGHVTFARGRAIALAIGVVIALSFTAPESRSASAYQIPATIPGDCSADVTQSILQWIAAVPDNSLLEFTPGACYRIEGTLEISNRNGLVFDGNGAMFKATTRGTASRSHWRLLRGSRISLKDMTIRGANAQPGEFDSSLQHQHGIDLRGVADVEVAQVAVEAPYGDCIYVGQPWDPSAPWSSGVHVHGSSCYGPGRSGIAVTAGRDVLVETSQFSVIGLNAFDIEPNGNGFGGTNVTFTRNQVGPTTQSILAALGYGTVAGVTLTHNTIVGRGLYVAALAPSGHRYSNFTIVGNVSDTGYDAPGSVAMDFVRIDGLTVTDNTVPLGGPNMALADVSESCSVNISGNRFPGGVAEARIHPYACPLPPPPPTPVPPPPPPPASQLDTTPPQTAITRGPGKRRHSRRATFRFTSREAGSSFRCSLDARAYVACRTPRTYKGLSYTRHTFRVYATDAAGNADATPAVWRWRVQRPSKAKSSSGSRIASTKKKTKTKTTKKRQVRRR